MKPQNLQIHIIEDDLVFGKLMELTVKSLGFTNIRLFNSGAHYLEKELVKSTPDIALVDYFLNDGTTGEQIIEKVKTIDRDVNTILMSSQLNAYSLSRKGMSHKSMVINKGGNFKGKLEIALRKTMGAIKEKNKRKKIMVGIALFFLADLLVSGSAYLLFNFPH